MKLPILPKGIRFSSVTLDERVNKQTGDRRDCTHGTKIVL